MRGFVKLKKSKKSEKNSEVGGWVKSQLGFLIFGGKFCFLCVFVLFSCFQMLKKGRWWVGSDQSEFFSDFFVFFFN